MLLQLLSVQACLRISVFRCLSEIKLDAAVTSFVLFSVVLQWINSPRLCQFLLLSFCFSNNNFYDEHKVDFFYFVSCVCFEFWDMVSLLAYLSWYSICRPSCCLPLPLECWIKGVHLQTQLRLLYLKRVLFVYFCFLEYFCMFFCRHWTCSSDT